MENFYTLTSIMRLCDVPEKAVAKMQEIMREHGKLIDALKQYQGLIDMDGGEAIDRLIDLTCEHGKLIKELEE